jgi:LVIVD repeat-containing protein
MSRLRSALLVSAVFVLVMAMVALAGAATQNVRNMSLEFFDAKTDNITSDIAFWGDTAFVGNYDGVRTYDISDPAAPVRLADFKCVGPQNDPSVYDTDGNGAADLLALSVDRTMTGPDCSATPTMQPDPENPGEFIPFHDDPNGWEGLRLFDVSNPANPVFLKAIYLDCGSHTNTMYPDLANNRLIALISSYPLREGPTCGPDLFNNTANPFDGDLGSPGDPLHGVIQTVVIPLMGNASASAAAATEGPELPITYPGDPDNKFLPSEHGLTGPDIVDGMRACHDTAVFVPLNKVAAACAEQGQMWTIDPATGLPDTSNPEWVFDRRNIDFHHSATFSWDGKVVNFIDESFGSGCPTVTKGIGQTGRMFFVDADSGGMFSSFMIRRSHKKEVPDYCSAHLGNVVPATDRYLLVNAWYTGGVDVIDFSNPKVPREIAFYDREGDEWSGYWYEQTGTSTTGDLNVFGTHGVEHVAHGEGEELFARGFESFLADVSATRGAFDHLNPQVQEQVIAADVSGFAKQAKKAASKAKTAASRQTKVKAEKNAGKVRRKAVLRRLAP